MLKTMPLMVGIGMTLLTASQASADSAWEKLDAEYAKAHEAWMAGMMKLQGEGHAMMFNSDAMPPHPIETFRPRFRKYAEDHANTPEALPALAHLLEGGFSMMGAKDKSAEWALARMKEHHAGDPKISDHIETIKHARMSVGEDAVIALMEEVAKVNPDRTTRGRAWLAMADMLYEGSPLARMMGTDNTPEAKAKKTRAIEILRKTSKEYPGTDIAKQADAFLYAIEHLEVGMKAPEIVGKDVNGQDIRLSQFNGKVVAIVFWGTWCAPCMEMLPHERELLEKNAGKPFIILGINANDSKADLKRAIKKEKITWPTIFDGMQDESSLVEAWRVRSFPMIYVVDHKGIIRHKQLIPFMMEKAVNELVAEAIKDMS